MQAMHHTKHLYLLVVDMYLNPCKFVDSQNDSTQFFNLCLQFIATVTIKLHII